MSNHQSTSSSRKTKRQLSQNVKAALLVAGESVEGKAAKLRPIDVMRKTGISRTTLRPILEDGDNSERTPDLETITKLADLLGVPVAFLLMTADDWRMLIRAMNSLSHYQKAADVLVGDGLGNAAMAEQVLRRCKVHPEVPPLGASPDPVEAKRLDARNHLRRRNSLVVSALAQPASRGERQLIVDLTALASALAVEMTQYNAAD